MKMLLCLLLALPFADNSMEKQQKDGKEYGKTHVGNQLEYMKSFDINSLKPEDFVEFDGNMALKRVQEEFKPKDPTNFVSDPKVRDNLKRKTFDEEDMLFSKADDIAEDPEMGLKEAEVQEPGYETYRCAEAGEPFDLELRRSLEVSLNYLPEEWAEVKTCLGHKETKKTFWKSEADKIAEDWRKKLAKDPSIKTYEVKISGGENFSDYKIKAAWKHSDESKQCKSFAVKRKKLSEERWEKVENWTNPSGTMADLAQSPQCTLVSLECLDKADRKINGMIISRKCWVEKQLYRCKYDERSSCDAYKIKKCLYVNRECKSGDNNRCALWENTYKCLKGIQKLSKKLKDEEIHGRDSSLYETDSEPSSTSGETIAILSVFAELKKELENTSVYDATQVEVFRGKNLQCARNIAGELVYDCCFSHKGLANDLKLSKCNADEVALTKMRDKGLCHYVGSYDETMLGMWTSSKKHSFCCFPSKLFRVLHEQAREQIKLSWGEPKKPDCRGLKQDEIKKIDFAQLDLSEAVESPEIKDYTEKLEAFETKMKEKMAKELR